MVEILLLQPPQNTTLLLQAAVIHDFTQTHPQPRSSNTFELREKKKKHHTLVTWENNKKIYILGHSSHTLSPFTRLSGKAKGTKA